jgi:hypothetical protein
VYGELGIDDYVANHKGGPIEGYLRYPLHTLAYTVGLKKTITINEQRNLYGELFFEWNTMEMSQDFQFQWPYNWYFHGTIAQGYTNYGQVLGAGSAWGGNSQYLAFKLYYPKGSSLLFVHRNNPDNNFLYSKAVTMVASADTNKNYGKSWKANFIVGLSTNYFIQKLFSINGGIAYNLIINPYYYYYKTEENIRVDEFIHNFSFQFGLKWTI